MPTKIIKKLNNYFTNNIELCSLCDELSNKPDRVIETINKIIKYAFVEKVFVNCDENLAEISHKLDNVDAKYQEYLNKKTFSLFKKNPKFDKEFLSMIESDIRLTDLEGLRLPTKEKIEEICRLNEKERISKSDRYKTQKVFSIEGFTYFRKELLTITPSFMYDYPDATGDIEYDFKKVYQDHRYKNRSDSTHPLSRDYQTNIENIKTQTDILLKKIGAVYEIYNGKHRILYIMKQGQPVEIAVTITRRIEDKEFNEILCILQEKYSARIYKNNILNDEPNILINISGLAYVIKNKAELLSFYKTIRDNEQLVNYQSIPFNIKTNENRIVYENMIYKKYLELGDAVLKSNFTDLFKYFDKIDNHFYYAFSQMQQMYQESKVYKIDFNICYQNHIQSMTNSNFDVEKWKKIMGPPRKNR